MKMGYKLFRIDKNGKIHPLYVLRNEEIEMGKWLDSEVGPICDDGKHVKGKTTLALRSGWHVAGSKPEAPQIKEDREKHVWCLVEVDDSLDCNELAKTEGKNKRDQCFRIIPKGGWYYYRTNAKQTEPWVIADKIRVTRIMSWNEVDSLREER